MKSDFSINVQVNVGVTPDVVALVKAILAHNQLPPISIDAAAPQPQPGVKPEQTEAQEAEERGEQAKADTATSEQPKPSETAPAEEKPKELTVADVREAMHKTRQRIEGEDYKEHTDSEAYKKYHRTLNGIFKQIAALLGSDLPSQLPPEQRQAFIDECEELKVLEDGTIGRELPF